MFKENISEIIIADSADVTRLTEEITTITDNLTQALELVSDANIKINLMIKQQTINEILKNIKLYCKLSDNETIKELQRHYEQIRDSIDKINDQYDISDPQTVMNEYESIHQLCISYLDSLEKMSGIITNINVCNEIIDDKTKIEEIDQKIMEYIAEDITTKIETADANLLKINSILDDENSDIMEQIGICDILLKDIQDMIPPLSD
jgi:hypothetical protein